MIDASASNKVLSVPRGGINEPPLQLDLTTIHAAESRIKETRIINSATSAELKSVFNEACNNTTKYIAWVKYEILRAEKAFDLAKATVLIDKLPDMLVEMKKVGIKDNADFRKSIVDRDTECQKMRDILAALEAVKLLLTAKAKSFDRAYWDARNNAEMNSKNPALPGLTMPGEGHLTNQFVDGQLMPIKIGVSKI